MISENIIKLINAIMENPELQEQLQEAVNKPVERGPAAADDKGLGSALLQALAGSQGLSFGSGDASQLTELLSAASQQGFGQSGSYGGNSSGGLQLLNSGLAAQQQTQQGASQGLQNIFQAAPVTQTTNSQPQAVTVDAETLNQFMQLFGGMQQAQQQTQQNSGLGGSGLLNLFGGQSAQQAQPVQQPSGQFFSLGDSGSSAPSSPLGGLGSLFGSSNTSGSSGVTGSSGMSNLILQLLMQLMLGK